MMANKLNTNGGMKISFLMAAHNEEKIIGEALDSLSKIPYENYEVIIGLDGCTDGTEGIVKRYCKKNKKMRYFKLNLREGKPAVINEIIQKAKGEIIIINDADWIFKFGNEKMFRNMLSVFKNPKIGGIADSFPVEWQEDKLKKAGIGFKMVAYSSYFWLQFQKKAFAEKNSSEEYAFLKKPTMFLTNIFRRKLYNRNSSLGDDFERTYDVMAQGYKIVFFSDIEMPRMISTYDKVNIRDLFKQKIRTAIARRQIEPEQKINFTNYYFPAVVYMNRESWKNGVETGLLVALWTVLTAFSSLLSRFSKKDTKEGWTLRAKRGD